MHWRQATRTTRVATTIAAGVGLAFVACGALDARGSDDRVKALVAATQTYVADLESKLAYGVFDEDCHQSARGDAGSKDRVTHGELFLTFLKADGDWIAVHDVATVDGEPVPDREELAPLLQRGSLQSIRADVTDRNARFNIGGISRNFNEPTLALLVFEPVRAADFDFSIERISADPDGVRVATLRFEQKRDMAGTFISGSGHGRPRVKGTALVETDTGRVRQTLVTLDVDDLSVALTTTYTRDATSGLWLPSVFLERYESRRKGNKELDTAETRYTNFRRFEVLGRIKNEDLVIEN